MPKIFIKIASVKKQYVTEQGIKHALKGAAILGQEGFIILV